MGPVPALTVERGEERFHPGDEIGPGPALARIVIDPGYRREVWQLYRLSVGYVDIGMKGCHHKMANSGSNYRCVRR
jgi:hypothetical protein